eukprot:1179121-Prorocentrum_minimum.AAC.2
MPHPMRPQPRCEFSEPAKSDSSVGERYVNLLKRIPKTCHFVVVGYPDTPTPGRPPPQAEQLLPTLHLSAPGSSHVHLAAHLLKRVSTSPELVHLLASPQTPSLANLSTNANVPDTTARGGLTDSTPPGGASTAFAAGNPGSSSGNPGSSSSSSSHPVVSFLRKLALYNEAQLTMRLWGQRRAERGRCLFLGGLAAPVDEAALSAAVTKALGGPPQTLCVAARRGYAVCVAEDAAAARTAAR